MFEITFHNSYFSGEKTPCFSSDKDFVSFEIAHKCRPWCQHLVNTRKWLITIKKAHILSQNLLLGRSEYGR